MYNLGMVLSSRGQYSEAIELLLRLLELKPDHVDGLSQLATCYLQKKETEKARELFELVLEKDPSNLMALQNLGGYIVITKAAEGCGGILSEALLTSLDPFIHLSSFLPSFFLSFFPSFLPSFLPSLPPCLQASPILGRNLECFLIIAGAIGSKRTYTICLWEFDERVILLGI